MARKFIEEELNNIINDYKNGMCPKDLGEKYNRDSATIIGKLQSMGIYKNITYSIKESRKIRDSKSK